MQQALDVSLVELSEHDPNAITVKPLFGPPSTCTDIFDVFVMMPFDRKLDPIYEDHLKKVCENQDLTICRGNDAFTTEAVMLDIWSQICHAKIVVADCTGRNPNVFYEVGLAHALGKPVILITQDNDDVPFDIRHIRYIQYEYTPRGMNLFEGSLEKTIKTTVANLEQS